MRINGRTLRPSNLRERRVLLAIGVNPITGLRVPRSENPFAVARTIQRLCRENDDIRFLRMLAQKKNQTPVPKPSPEVDTPNDQPDAAE